MEAMAPGFARAETAIEDCASGSRRPTSPTRWSRARVHEAAAHFPTGATSTSRSATASTPASPARSSRSTPTCSVTTRTSTARRRVQDAHRAEDHRRRGRARAGGCASSTSERVAGLMEDVDLIVTPDDPVGGATGGRRRPELRGRMLSLTFPWNAVGGPALALPCGPAEDGLPASVQLMGRPGEDALVLAAAAGWRARWSARARCTGSAARRSVPSSARRSRLEAALESLGVSCRAVTVALPAEAADVAAALSLADAQRTTKPSRCCAHSSRTSTNAARGDSSAAARSRSPASTTPDKLTARERHRRC